MSQSPFHSDAIPYQKSRTRMATPRTQGSVLSSAFFDSCASPNCSHLVRSRSATMACTASKTQSQRSCASCMLCLHGLERCLRCAATC